MKVKEVMAELSKFDGELIVGISIFCNQLISLASISSIHHYIDHEIDDTGIVCISAKLGEK